LGSERALQLDEPRVLVIGGGAADRGLVVVVMQTLACSEKRSMSRYGSPEIDSGRSS